MNNHRDHLYTTFLTTCALVVLRLLPHPPPSSFNRHQHHLCILTPTQSPYQQHISPLSCTCWWITMTAGTKGYPCYSLPWCRCLNGKWTIFSLGYIYNHTQSNAPCFSTKMVKCTLKCQLIERTSKLNKPKREINVNQRSFYLKNTKVYLNSRNGGYEIWRRTSVWSVCKIQCPLNSGSLTNSGRDKERWRMKRSGTEKNGRKGERSTHRLEEDVPMGDELILLFARMRGERARGSEGYIIWSVG